MPDITFDLATKFIEKGQVIWAVFPGRGRRFLDAFVVSRAIFLETPGIKLTARALEDDDLLRKHVAMSNAVASYRAGAVDKPPSRNPNAYEAKRNASFNSAVGNVRNMFAKMKPGDLVIMGGKSLYRPVIAGEVTAPFDPTDVIESDFYDGEGLPFRRMKWFPVREERRYLSERLSHLLSNRHAVISLSKEEFADEIYTMAYGDFVFGEDSRYVFPGPRYRNIATSTVPGIDLISYFIAAFHACDIKELDKFAKLDVRTAIDSYFEQDILRSFELDFASPGNYVVYSRRAALALTAALLVAATVGDMTLAKAKAAQVVNSVDDSKAATPHQVEILDKYHAIMESLGAERYNDLVKLNKLAQDGVGLKVNVKVKQKKK